MRTTIFLDIDGVLNNTAGRAAVGCQFHHVCTYAYRPLAKTDLDIDEDCMARFGKLITEFNPDVVISSMWRFGAKMEWFTEMFALYGITIPANKIFAIRTDDCEDLEGDRQMWIEEYLIDNPCDNYVILDDTGYHFKTLYHPNLVLTDITFGLTDANYEKARSILLTK